MAYSEDYYSEDDGGGGGLSFYERSTFEHDDGSSYMMVYDDVNNSQMPITRLEIDCEIQVATAFVSMVGYYKAEKSGTLYLRLPTNKNTTMTSVVLTIGDREIETVVMSPEQLEEVTKQARKGKKSEAPPATDRRAAELTRYDPQVFTMPIPDVRKGDLIVADVSYLEPLSYSQAEFRIDLPLRISESALNGRSVASIVSANVSIFTGTHGGKAAVTSSSHQINLSTSNVDHGHVTSAVVQFDNAQNDDISLAYTVSYSQIQGALLVKPPTPFEKDNTGDDRGTFLLFLTPPYADSVANSPPRKIEFLLDRSGSMGNTVMGLAKEALIAGLRTLREQDVFNINAFDHETMMFSPTLLYATADNISRAVSWVEGLTSRGGTDILTPIASAISALAAFQGSLPFIYLITDGAVSNEREICRYVQAQGGDARFMTFGIGKCCNSYFLRMLSLLGKGYTDVALTPEGIRPQITRLCEIAQTPVLLDITLLMEGCYEVELYPFPIPDVFVGAPLVVAGKYRGVFPEAIEVRGVSGSSGRAKKVKVSRRDAGDFEIDRVFIKQRLDMLVAQYWLDESPGTKNQIIALSSGAGIPCPYTSFVGYEVPAKEKENRRKARRSGGSGRSSKELDDDEYSEDFPSKRSSSKGKGKGKRSGKGPSKTAVTDQSHEPRKPSKKSQGMSTGAKVAIGAAVLGGGALLYLGATSGSFGDVGATASGVSSMDFAGNFEAPNMSFDFGGAENIGGDCCNTCSDMCNGQECDNILNDCGSCDCDALGNDCGSFFEQLFRDAENAFNDCGANCENMCNDIECDCGNCNADCCGNASEGVGNAAGSVDTSLCGECGNCFTECGQCATECVGACDPSMCLMACAC